MNRDPSHAFCRRDGVKGGLGFPRLSDEVISGFSFSLPPIIAHLWLSHDCDDWTETVGCRGTAQDSRILPSLLSSS
jgi:hypothetical protein